MADNRIDVHSATWKLIEAYLKKEIINSHTQLESPGLSSDETEFQRGRISLCRQLLNEAKPKVVISSAFAE